MAPIITANKISDDLILDIHTANAIERYFCYGTNPPKVILLITPTVTYIYTRSKLVKSKI